MSSPVNPQKQSTAFPPNFVHSLDASHMMLSALACQKHQITYASVHDSYWTHACDVDVMSKIIRDTFIRLHSEDIMGRLKSELEERYQQHRISAKIAIETPEDWEKVKQILALQGRKCTKALKSLKVWVPLTLDPLPPKGQFQIDCIRDSNYFFH